MMLSQVIQGRQRDVASLSVNLDANIPQMFVCLSFEGVKLGKSL